jgi:hypothetical protein
VKQIRADERAQYAAIKATGGAWSGTSSKALIEAIRGGSRPGMAMPVTNKGSVPLFFDTLTAYFQPLRVFSTNPGTCSSLSMYGSYFPCPVHGIGDLPSLEESFAMGLADGGAIEIIEHLACHRIGPIERHDEY